MQTIFNVDWFANALYDSGWVEMPYLVMTVLYMPYLMTEMCFPGKKNILICEFKNK